MKINAQHNALSIGIKTSFKIGNIYYATFRRNLRRHVINIFYSKSCFYNITQSIMLDIDLGY